MHFRRIFSRVCFSILAPLLLVPGLAFAKGGGHGGGSSHSHASSSSRSSGSTHVRGYTRKNGTYVAPHERSKADGNFYNNWSTKGNINPFTGKAGTRVTLPGSSSGSNVGGTTNRSFGTSSGIGVAVPLGSVPSATPASLDPAGSAAPISGSFMAPSDEGRPQGTAVDTAGDAPPLREPDRPISKRSRPTRSDVQPLYFAPATTRATTTASPQTHLDLDNARYWIDHGHKNWARGLLLGVTIDAPGTSTAKSAEEMLRELNR